MKRAKDKYMINRTKYKDMMQQAAKNQQEEVNPEGSEIESDDDE